MINAQNIRDHAAQEYRRNPIFRYIYDHLPPRQRLHSLYHPLWFFVIGVAATLVVRSAHDRDHTPLILVSLLALGGATLALDIYALAAAIQISHRLDAWNTLRLTPLPPERIMFALYLTSVMRTLRLTFVERAVRSALAGPAFIQLTLDSLDYGDEWLIMPLFALLVWFVQEPLWRANSLVGVGLAVTGRITDLGSRILAGAFIALLIRAAEVGIVIGLMRVVIWLLDAVGWFGYSDGSFMVSMVLLAYAVLVIALTYRLLLAIRDRALRITVRSLSYE